MKVCDCAIFESVDAENSRLEVALAAANRQISDLQERIRELELLLAAQKQEWSKAYDIGVTCKHHLAAEREVLLAEQALSDKLEKALKSTLSHLVAATSLLERGPKTAASSNKMFDQMVLDYTDCASKSRAILAEVAAIRSNRYEV